MLNNSSDAKLLYIDSFLTEYQCNFLIQKSSGRLSSRFRTSLSDGRTGYVFRDENDVTLKVRSYIAKEAGCDIDHVSPVELVRYEPSSGFCHHYDGWWRNYTCLIYLNDDFTGGHTRFPLLDVHGVVPKQGCSIFWENARDGANLRVHGHEALPVMAGVKYIAVAWAEVCPVDRDKLSGTPPVLVRH